MMNIQMLRLAVLCVFFVVVSCQTPNGTNPKQFAAYLANNVNQGPHTLPVLSYQVWPTDYFANVPDNLKPHDYNTSQFSLVCGGNVSADAWNAYEFQTEQLINQVGLNIYDAAVWAIATALLGDTQTPSTYHSQVLQNSSTLQIDDIRGDEPCKGVIYWGQCTDVNDTGRCGLCYGNNAVSLPKDNAYLFRMISDYFSLQNTTMALCPEKNLSWAWNDWKPVTGENAWSSLVGALQVAFIRANGDVNNIPDDCAEMNLAIRLIPAFEAMQIPAVGAIYYAPRNMFYRNLQNIGSSVSTENNASLFAGLSILLDILTNKAASTLKSYIPRVQNLLSGIEHYLQMAYSPELGFFRQGGSYDVKTQTWSWGQATGIPLFATDCQTWVGSVLGPERVDSWFGPGTSVRLWNTTKQIAGYKYDPTTGSVNGVGYTNNTVDEVFSGEWTFGAINWLRILANSSLYDPYTVESLNTDAASMRQAITDELTTTHPLRNPSMTGASVLYANKRYFIPFGWWANSLPATASTAWAVMADSNYNPFVLGGYYTAAGANNFNGTRRAF